MGGPLLTMTRIVMAVVIALVAACAAAPTSRPNFAACLDFMVFPVAGVTPTVAKTFRGGGDHKDPGWGVDMAFSGRDPKTHEQTVHAAIWDSDGDGFFKIQVGANNYCKVDAGSNGLAPGATAEVYEMAGLQCTLTQLRDRDDEQCFKFQLGLNETHTMDCMTPEAARAPKGT